MIAGDRAKNLSRQWPLNAAPKGRRTPPRAQNQQVIESEACMGVLRSASWLINQRPAPSGSIGNSGKDTWRQSSATVNDGPYGSAYTTALAILALTPPYQILPIYQR
jgi:hypothetical protein